ncbi:VCBS repeat-containing protein [Streptomyces sp. NPDC002825]|uniref:FG-GAP repeat domain-containing protein n=1 Tax=Streptomyces sp. NPDC002825 TaxID=3154666 RepID=UPI00331AD036
MSHRRVSSVAVGVVVALAATSLTPAAFAAPAAVALPAAVTAAPVPVPFLAAGGTIEGAGTTGFLSRDSEGVSRWTRYADGVSKVITTYTNTRVEGTASDKVAVVKNIWHAAGDEQVTLTDMASGAAPVAVDLPRSPDGWVTGVVGSDIVMNELEDEGHAKLVRKDAGTVTVRRVTEPDGSLVTRLYAGDSLPGLLLSDDKVVDLKTARVVEKYPGSRSYKGLNRFSSSHVAWTEQGDGRLLLASAKRGTAEVTRVPLDYDPEASLVGGLLGGWFMSSGTGPSGDAAAMYPLTARSLTDGTSFALLDHAESVTKGPGNTLLALGVTAAHGSGVYRIALGADGRPFATLIAATGEPNEGFTPLSYVESGVPAVVNLDGAAKTPLTWKFSTTRANLTVVLKNKETSESFRTTVRPPVDGSAGTGVYPGGALGFAWAGEFRDGDDEGKRAAFNGDYTWEVTATPWNGTPPVTATGSFTVTRGPKPHDYTDNGSPDLFARAKNGYLYRIDTRWDDATGRFVPAYDWEYSSEAGWGWNSLDRVESVGDVAGSSAPDTVGRDLEGVLWLYQGTGDNNRFPLESRVRIGSGWYRYEELAGGSDLTGDGRADLVAMEYDGGLFLYAGTGDAAAPFAPRRKIGFGWNIYDQLVAVGNVAGAPAGDLLARDKAGVLWLYLGKGDGSYAPRVKVGAGWGVYGDLVGIGDANKDGRPDLFARGANNTSYFYAGTGDWRAPFKPRASTSVGVYREGMYGTPFNKFA